MKNSLQFSSLVLNTKVGRDIQVSSLHTKLKKKKNHVEVNKPSCILQEVEAFNLCSYIHMHRIQCSNKKRISQKVIKVIYYCDISRLPQLCLKTRTQLTEFPMCFFFVIFFFFSLNCPVQEKVLTKFHRPKMCKLVSLYTAMTSGISEISP